MADKKNETSWRPSRFFVLRTPLLPFEELERWGQGLETPEVRGEDVGRLDLAVAADRERLRGRLLELLDRPEIREAIFVASPSLFEALEAWRRAPESKAGLRAERALTRYLVRMTARATPFGLFSGCSVGSLAADGEPTRVELVPRREYLRHTRFDMDYLFALAEELGRWPELRRELTWRPNSSLYWAAGRWRYAESRLDRKLRTYHLVAVEATDYLDATLERAGGGASLDALASALVASDPGGEVSREEAEEYLDALIDSQMLVSDLAPRVTGGEAVIDLADVLGTCAAGSAAAAVLERAHRALQALDAGGLGHDPERYRDLGGELETALPTAVEISRLYQVDMVKPVRLATLSALVVEELQRGVEVLRHLVGPMPDEALDRFRQAFIERYGERREMPLAEVLDEETGIGFGSSGGASAEASPLVAGLPLPPPPREQTAPWEERQVFLLHKLQEVVERGQRALELSARDLERLAASEPAPLPDAFYIMACIAAASEQALAEGDFQLLLRGAAGPSGARLLGRFCHADEALRQVVEEHLAAEEALRPEAVFAEIVHLPEGRIGNILARPLLRPWEIPFLGRSAVPEAHQIPLADLRVSVVGPRIVLTSARLGKEIIPRLTTAHNFVNRSLGVYRFLCALQSQGVVGGLGWSWGPLERARFLPRVTHGRLVLSRARWWVPGDELEELMKAAGGALVAELRRWRQRRSLPRRVVLLDADNELPVDLDNILSVESFLDVAKGRPGLTLAELFPSPEALWVRSPEGRFVQEIVVPFVRTGKAPEVEERAPRPAPKVAAAPVRLELPPSSEWLYTKLYCGAATADRVLCEVVAPVVRDAMACAAADAWFFIRYSDPESHLRLRLHGDPEALHQRVLPALLRAAAAWLDDGCLWRVQLDTYRREVARYGGAEGIAVAERLFWADSEAVLAIVEQLEGDAGADARWRLALRGVDTLLGVLGLDLAARQRVALRLREGYTRELSADLTLKRQLGERYRKERESLEALMDPANDAGSPLEPGFEALARGARLAAPAAEELRRLEAEGRLTAPVEELALSFAHMHVNRLIRSEARVHELVLYEFLHRAYSAQAAREKGQRAASTASRA